MIVITIELWKKGSRLNKVPRGKIIIVNDGTGSKTKGNYDVHFYDRNGRGFRSERLENWPRNAKSIWKMLNKIFGGCDETN